MINNGPVQIGTNIEHIDGIDNRHITIVGSTSPEPQTNQAESSTKTSSTIRLNPRKNTKLNFFRVVKALCEKGFFVDETGAKANDEDVFDALAAALNDNFSDFSRHLSEGRNHNSPDLRAKIFSDLEDAYRAYEKALIDRMNNR